MALPPEQYCAFTSGLVELSPLLYGNARSSRVLSMKLRFWRYDLKLAHRWTVSSGAAPGGSGGTEVYPVVMVELTDRDGLVGLGEVAPSARYEESAEWSIKYLESVNSYQLSSGDIPGSMQYLESIAPRRWAAKAAMNVALWDLAARRAGQSVADHLELGFTEGRHMTSFSLGIDTPEVMRQKTLEAASYPVLKLKVGCATDQANLAAVREVAPGKPLRLDANEAWKTKEEALAKLEWLAKDRSIQFVEQPMPSSSPREDWIWLKERTPLPIFADESYLTAADIGFCSEVFHGVNVKLAKTCGISGAVAALKAARQAGLKTMLGCMIESSVLITAAAHLAELTDYLDLDGCLLITNDPYQGVSLEGGRLSFASARDPLGLRVRARY